MEKRDCSVTWRQAGEAVKKNWLKKNLSQGFEMIERKKNETNKQETRKQSKSLASEQWRSCMFSGLTRRVCVNECPIWRIERRLHVFKSLTCLEPAFNLARWTKRIWKKWERLEVKILLMFRCIFFHLRFKTSVHARSQNEKSRVSILFQASFFNLVLFYSVLRIQPGSIAGSLFSTSS